MKTSLRGLKTKFSNRRYKDGRRAVIVRNGYGPNWKEQKLKALERDEYKCTKCGGKLGIAVHHRRKIRYFVDSVAGTVDYEKANDLNNLTTLCRVCHKVADQHDAPSKRGWQYISK